MACVRALTIHIPSELQNLDVIDRVAEFVAKVRFCARSSKLDPWTTRLVYPAISGWDEKAVDSYLKNLFSVLDNDILVCIGVEPGSKALDAILQLLQKYPNLFSSTRCDSDDCVQKVVNKVYEDFVQVLDPDTYSKFAILFGSWIESPYFPATSSTSNVLGISVALRYADLVYKALIQGEAEQLFHFIEDVVSKTYEVARCSGAYFLGVDLSLSPWREESVVAIIEKLIGNKIGFPGTINTIFSLNRLVKGLAKKLGVVTTGFNEVMLSVAEDNILNERVKEMAIRLRDLISYSALCAAGLDMVAVPRSIDITRIAIDMLTIYRVKGRSVAMRIIPVDGGPGTEILLKRFGVTYVIEP